MATENKLSRNCPSCGSGAIRRARKNLISRIRLLAGRQSYRCRACRQRFHMRVEPAAKPRAKIEASVEPRTESRKRRRALKRREVFVYSAALIAFAVIVFIITRERG